MIDIHSHVLPGIDDGAPDLATAVAMCRMARTDGCEAIIATPHQRHNAWANTDPERLERLRRRVGEAVGDRPRILPGAEIRIDSTLLDDLERMPASGLTPLAGSRYLLLEFRRGGPETDPEELIHEVMVAGWRPIVAHPELIGFLASDIDLVRRLVARGALCQITAMSVTGGFGARIKRLAGRLLSEDLVHFIASDCHGDEWRPPGLSEARKLVARTYGGQTARRLTLENPLAVLQNRPISTTEVVT